MKQGKPQPETTEAQQKALGDLVRRMRQIAEPVGPLHGWWDAIFDVEAFLRGDVTQVVSCRVDWTASQWIADCEQMLARRERVHTVQTEAAVLPVHDSRPPDEIVGYDENGIATGPETPKAPER